MVNIETFGTKLSNPLESSEDKAVENNLLDDATIEMYPESRIEGLESHNQCSTLIFRTKSRSGQSWRDMAKFYSNHSIRMDSLNLEIDSNATFRMKLSRFIMSDILGPLKVMIDQFVSEGVLVPDISCSHASPLVIGHKKEGGIRMAVDYRDGLSIFTGIS